MVSDFGKPTYLPNYRTSFMDVPLQRTPYVQGIFWKKKTYILKAIRLLTRKYVNEGFQIFWKRSCGCLQVKGLQSYSPSIVEDDQNHLVLKLRPHSSGLTPAKWQNFFLNLQIWQLVTLKPFAIQNPQYLFGKILNWLLT